MRIRNCFLAGLALVLLGAPAAWAVMAGEPRPTPSNIDLSNPAWDEWFKDNALVTDKDEYVHFFWNAQDYRGRFESKDKKTKLGEAALQLVSRLYPEDAKADRVKVDIVYVLERDAYGMPDWSSLQKAAHLEFDRSKALKLAGPKLHISVKLLKKLFDQFELFP